MFARALDELLALAAVCGYRPLRGVFFVPVLHVERLHDDASFNNALVFAQRYKDLTGKRCIQTVVTPLSPLLKAEMKLAGVDDAFYEARLRALGEHSDLGLHGHFVRESRGVLRPVHHFWNESALIKPQLEAECHWLESRGLMSRRVYSAGWWYLDSDVLKALCELGFEFDFSASATDFNASVEAHQRLARDRNPDIFFHDPARTLAGVWAMSGLGGSRARSAVPRRVLGAFPRRLVSRAPSVLSLYSHDWDMDVDAALRSVSDLLAQGAVFQSLDGLYSQSAAMARLPGIHTPKKAMT